MVKKYTKSARIRYGIATADRRHLQYIRQRLIAEHGMVCALCGKPIESGDELTVDHIVPRTMGGATTYGNCQLAHESCNSRKGDKYIASETAGTQTEMGKKGVDKAQTV